MPKIRVLIVDDSLFYSEMLKMKLNGFSDIEVVGCVSNPNDIFNKVALIKPDVITMDIVMPGVNGLDLVKQLIEKQPLPIVVISGQDFTAFQALQAGAIDFARKPQQWTPSSVDEFIGEIHQKLVVGSKSRVHALRTSASAVARPVTITANTKRETVIAIGASTGGTEAIYEVVRNLPANCPGIVIVQHMPPGFTKMFADRLDKNSKLSVKEAADGDRLAPGKVLVGPGDYQMTLGKDTNGYYVRVRKGEKVSGHCPSVDVLFKSVADAAGSAAVGVILTGMGGDGAKGLLKMRKAGAKTYGQSEDSCVVYGMPKVAYDIGAVSQQVTLAGMAAVICKAVSVY